jgi:hypothetical protein
MGWREIQLPVKAANPNAAVVVGLAPKSRMAPTRLVVTVRTTLLPELAWWKAGGTVAALLGDGEHAGKLRLVSGGAFQLSVLGGHFGKGGSVSVFFPAPPGHPAERQARTPVKFAVADGCCRRHASGLVIDLPAWIRQTSGPAAAPAAPLPAVAAQAGFRSAATVGRAPAGLVRGR